VIVAVVIVVLLIGAGIAMYNGLVGARNRNENAFAQVDTELTRRHDLIPNLVETVKGYATHERETLERVIAARNAATTATGVADKVQAENVLTGALKSLFAVAEAYPDLKANVNFQQLQAQLSETEDRIAFSRKFFNDNVRIYNDRIQKFPSSIVARMGGFSRAEYLVADETQRQNVNVSFDQP
jgi:LemA protein